MMVAAFGLRRLAEVAPHLHWKQNANYSDELLGAGYMDGYAYCEFIGPHGFFRGDDFLMGLAAARSRTLLQGSCSPAPELYWTLTGPSLWRRTRGRVRGAPGRQRDLARAQYHPRHAHNGSAFARHVDLDTKTPSIRHDWSRMSLLRKALIIAAADLSWFC